MWKIRLGGRRACLGSGACAGLALTAGTARAERKLRAKQDNMRSTLLDCAMSTLHCLAQSQTMGPDLRNTPLPKTVPKTGRRRNLKWQVPCKPLLGGSVDLATPVHRTSSPIANPLTE